METPTPEPTVIVQETPEAIQARRTTNNLLGIIASPIIAFWGAVGFIIALCVGGLALGLFLSAMNGPPGPSTWTPPPNPYEKVLPTRPAK